MNPQLRDQLVKKMQKASADCGECVTLMLVGGDGSRDQILHKLEAAIAAAQECLDCHYDPKKDFNKGGQPLGKKTAAAMEAAKG